MSNLLAIEAGDIVWLNFDPRTGHEQSGKRPAVVISNKLLAERTNLAIVMPITSRIKGLPFEIKLTNTQTYGVVLPFQIRSVDLVAREAEFVERAPASILRLCREAVSAMMQ